jgi:ABC-type phosphate transport system permease subunit
MHGETYYRVLSTSGSMIVSAIIVLSIAYLPTLASTILATLNILPTHLV